MLQPVKYPSVSIVVPTFEEATTIAALIEKIDEVLVCREAIDLELIIVDDNSRDGIEAVVDELKQPWVRFHRRTEPSRGLSESVLCGFDYANNDVLVVMDADLSHPPEAVPAMLLALLSGFEIVVGSRYVAGGTTDHNWGILRWLNSRIATCLTRPLTDLKDPMSGFFALFRDKLKPQAPLRPTGYKIGLEIIVKCGFQRVAEVPIQFKNRTTGESKLTLKEQLRFMRHLRRLYIYRARFWTDLIQFGCVGGSGIMLNLVVVTLAVNVGIPDASAIALGILLSFFSNFVLNRLITFSDRREQTVWHQLFGFAAACSIGALANLLVAQLVVYLRPEWPIQSAVLLGVACGFIFNFVINRYHVFKCKTFAPGSCVENE